MGKFIGTTNIQDRLFGFLTYPSPSVLQIFFSQKALCSDGSELSLTPLYLIDDTKTTLWLYSYCGSGNVLMLYQKAIVPSI